MGSGRLLGTGSRQLGQPARMAIGRRSRRPMGRSGPQPVGRRRRQPMGSSSHRPEPGTGRWRPSSRSRARTPAGRTSRPRNRRTRRVSERRPLDGKVLMKPLPPQPIRRRQPRIRPRRPAHWPHPIREIDQRRASSRHHLVDESPTSTPLPPYDHLSLLTADCHPSFVITISSCKTFCVYLLSNLEPERVACDVRIKSK